MKTLEELKRFYESLHDSFEGYIQMSDAKLQIIKHLPPWETLHNGRNFIFEMALFDGKRSILVRQINDRFIIIDKNILDYTNTTKQTYIAKGGKKVKMVQVWEEKEDENCLHMKVLTPTLQLFAGFVEGEER